MEVDLDRGLGRKSNIRFIILGVVIIALGVSLTILFLTLPKIKLVKNKGVSFEYQEKQKCAGYSAAYVLRCLGIDAKGADIYNEIENKTEEGFVNPTDLKKVFENRNIKSEVKNNQSLDDLKKDLDKNVPIIVLAKSNPTSTYNHYITVVGYTKTHIYFFDSLKSEATTLDNSRYNRYVSNEDFLKMWDISSEYKNTYILVENK